MSGYYVGECGYYSYCKVDIYRLFVGIFCLHLHSYCFFLNLKVNPTGLSETSINTYQTAQCWVTKQTLRRLQVLRPVC